MHIFKIFLMIVTAKWCHSDFYGTILVTDHGFLSACWCQMVLFSISQTDDLPGFHAQFLEITQIGMKRKRKKNSHPVGGSSVSGNPYWFGRSEENGETGSS